MLNKTLTRLGVLLIGAFLLQGDFQALAAQGGSTNIAVVDLELIVIRSQQGQALQKKLGEFQQSVQVEGQRLSEEAEALRQRAADGAQTLSDDKIAELQKELEDKMIAIRRFRDDKQREGEKMRNEGLQAIEQQLEPIFKAVRDEGGYDLILNNVPGVVVMANERVDITQKVIERLDGGAAAGE